MKSLPQLKIRVVNKFPLISSASRFLKALYLSNTCKRPSYSQHGEDKYILDFLSNNLPNQDYKFIDVGAFHPMLLSNTYLFYRNNFTGVIIEPNKELCGLHKIFRPKDVHLQIACGGENSISRFFLQKTFPALSSLDHFEDKDKKIVSEYVPVFDLDTICSKLDFEDIHFLSIDVEGFDFEVLAGGHTTLKKTFLVCVECNDETTEKKVRGILKENNFTFLRSFSCNFIFLNKTFKVADQ